MIILIIILMGLFFLITTSSSMFADTASQDELNESGVSLHSLDTSDDCNNDDNCLLPPDYFVDLHNPEILFNEDRCNSHDI